MIHCLNQFYPSVLSVFFCVSMKAFQHNPAPAPSCSPGVGGVVAALGLVVAVAAAVLSGVVVSSFFVCLLS